MDFSGLGSLINTGMSLYGAMKSSKAEGNITDAYGQGLAALSSLVPPSLADLTVELQQYVDAGDITPEEYVTYLQEQSALQGVEIPEEVLNAQYEVLNNLKDIVNSGGLTATDKAKINDIRQEVLTTARGNAQRTQQEFAERGTSGSGMELASRLSNDSAAIQAASKQGFDVAALAEQRALDALTQYGSQANTMRSQDYTQQSDLAKANDAINQFNTKAKQSTADANVTAQNQANAANLAEAQRISDANTGVANTQATQNAQATQAVFDNAYKKAGGLNTAGTTVGNAATNAAARDENFYGNVGNAVGDLIDQYGKKKKTTTTTSGSSSSPDYSTYDFGSTNYTVSDERVKTDIKDLSDDDIDNILDSLTGKKFNYAKNFRNDGKTHVGIIAQDVESTPVGATMVVEKNGIKGIDNGEAAMLALSALSNIHKRVKKMEGK